MSRLRMHWDLSLKACIKGFVDGCAQNYPCSVAAEYSSHVIMALCPLLAQRDLEQEKAKHLRYSIIPAYKLKPPIDNCSECELC